jgi:hypothetical protein
VARNEIPETRASRKAGHFYGRKPVKAIGIPRPSNKFALLCLTRREAKRNDAAVRLDAGFFLSRAE